VDELLDDLANAPDDAIRISALRDLRLLDKDLALVALISSLQDPSEGVRLAALSGLRESKDPKAFKAVATLADRPAESRNIRISAVRALAAMGDPRAVERLVKVLPHARSEIAQDLLAIGPAAIPALVEALRHPDFRDAATSTLVAFGPPAVPALVDTLQGAEEQSARLAAATALAEIEDPRAGAALDAAISAGGDKIVIVAYRHLIRRGQPGSENRLVTILYSSLGRRPMAEDFFSSGNPVLSAAAKVWLQAHGGSSTLRLSELPEVRWGGVDPSVRRLMLAHFDGSLTSTSSVSPVASSRVKFVPGKWGSAIQVETGGILKYPLQGSLDLSEGTIEMWIAPVVDVRDPIYTKYNHALLLYHSPAAEQFLVSESVGRSFYAGVVVGGKFTGSGGGSIAEWKASGWRHIAFTYSSGAGRARFYIDGAQVGENQGVGPRIDVSGGEFTVGCDPYGNWTAFAIDELLISSGEKNAAAIRNNAARSAPIPD
jgi:hypothetical protein